MFHLMQTREAFENRLRTMQGVEFMVAYEPKQPAAEPVVLPGAAAAAAGGGDISNIWVIRKQIRRKQQGYEDEVTVLSTFFIVGENVYMAPSVASVIGCRLLSTVTALTKFLSTASSLPLFSPSVGNTYTRPTPVAPTSAPTIQLTAQASKESTPMPDNVPRTVKVPTAAAAAATTESLQETRSLAESFNMTLRYMDEYIDENPLQGEPGSFILSTAHGPSHSKNPSQAKPTTTAKTAADSETATEPPTDGEGAGATAKKTTTTTSGEKNPTGPNVPAKPKRRKSKVTGVIGGGVTQT
ncbi:MAG: Mediator of RNA polymerase II transcription subunit 6 [Peltula sp. TS41687]|nr:MAG: Mediator of RNA polymerase II transcription subunit 6 [Peltula sp. TS41687]